jgi:predicted anti-sigma-YlaC factor YlaD
MMCGSTDPAMRAAQPPENLLHRRIAAWLAVAIAISASACSIQGYAVDSLASALSKSGGTFASDDDPELIREALPFSLKLIESVLAEAPDNEALLVASARGFTLYAYAFVQQDAEKFAERDLARAEELRARSRKLYARAMSYGLRALALRHPAIGETLRRDPKLALADTTAADVPSLYWTAASWGALLAISKDHPEIIADQPIVEALIDRALALDEGFDSGAIHTFLISYEPSRSGARAGWEERSRGHFDRAVAESDRALAAPYLALAETVSLQNQDRREFESLLATALAIDVDARPEWRLQNLVAQERARWLLSRRDELFVE